MPQPAGNNAEVLRAFAEHIVRDDPVTRRVLFDLSYLPFPDETAQETAALTEQIRRIDIKRFLFGSDFNERTPLEEIKEIDKLGLTRDELQILQQNCAPWACHR